MIAGGTVWGTKIALLAQPTKKAPEGAFLNCLSRTVTAVAKT